MEKKDILFLCQFFYPEYVSSATLPYDTAKALKEAGFFVDVMCGYPKEYVKNKSVPTEENIEGINIYRLKYLQFKRSNFLGRLINYCSFVIVVFLHLFKLKNYKTVIVYTNPPILPLFAVLAKKIFKIKVILVAYDIYPEIMIKTGIVSENSILSKIMKCINGIVYPNLDKVITLSSDMKEFIKNNRNIIENRVISIPNWYEEVKEEETIVKFTEKYKNKIIISYLGNLGTCQDLETILGAIRILKSNNNITFVFAGHGNKMELLHKIVKEEKLKNVDILGFLQKKEYEAILSISKFAIVSIASGLIGLCAPSKVYGYMMAGIPIIAIMDELEIKEKIKEYNAGFVLKNGESIKMVKFITESINNKIKMNEMSINSKRLFLDNYTKNKCLQKYVLFMKEFLKDI